MLTVSGANNGERYSMLEIGLGALTSLCPGLRESRATHYSDTPTPCIIASLAKNTFTLGPDVVAHTNSYLKEHATPFT